MPSVGAEPKNDNSASDNSAVGIARILAERNVPVRIGEPAYGLVVASNSIVVLVGQNPDPLSASVMVWRTKLSILDFERTAALTILYNATSGSLEESNSLKTIDALRTEERKIWDQDSQMRLQFRERSSLMDNSTNAPAHQ